VDLRGGKGAQENPNAVGDACPLDGTILKLVAVFAFETFADLGREQHSLFVGDNLSRRFSHETMQLSLTWGEP
jgi:hypothetical protein